MDDALATDIIASMVDGLADYADFMGEEYGPEQVRDVLTEQWWNDPPRRDLTAVAASLRAARNGFITPPAEAAPATALPDGGGVDLNTRIAAYRRVLPANDQLGQVKKAVASYTGLDLAKLAAGEVPEVKQTTGWHNDLVNDNGPGDVVLAHVALLTATGRDVRAERDRRAPEVRADLNRRFTEAQDNAQVAVAEQAEAESSMRQIQVAVLQRYARDAGFDNFAAADERARDKIRSRALNSKEVSVARRRQTTAQQAALKAIRARTALQGAGTTAKQDTTLAVLAVPAVREAVRVPVQGGVRPAAPSFQFSVDSFTSSSLPR
ncbi:MAG: hypothetical protein ACR2HA_06925 [Nocardioides sp.]